jgi:hypothetical protein
MAVKLGIKVSGPKYDINICEQGAEENTVFKRVLFAPCLSRT